MKTKIYHLAIIIMALGAAFGIMGIYQESNEMIYLKRENATLNDYKNAYLEHVAVCDTLHQKCFRNKN